jgi:hypothetical protein
LHNARQPKLPTEAQLNALHAEVARIITEGSPDVQKQVVVEFVDHVDITPNREVTPYFRIPDLDRPGPILSSSSVCSRTAVRIGSTNVEVTSLGPPACPLRALQLQRISRACAAGHGGAQRRRLDLNTA